jgi:hypothetical protein
MLKCSLATTSRVPANIISTGSGNIIPVTQGHKATNAIKATKAMLQLTSPTKPSITPMSNLSMNIQKFLSFSAMWARTPSL